MGCERKGNISIIVKNVGDSPLDSAVVLVTGNSYKLGKIFPGDSVTTKVNPHGESHLEIDFKNAKNEKKHFVVGSYFETGYSGFMNIRLNADSIVSVTDSIAISKY